MNIICFEKWRKGRIFMSYLSFWDSAVQIGSVQKK
jgi:hypothetical protein